MSLSGMFKKIVATALAGTVAGIAYKSLPDREPDDSEILKQFEQHSSPRVKDNRPGIGFSVGETSFYVPKKKDFDKILQALPIVDSKIKFSKWQVPEKVLNANIEASLKFGVPLSLMMKIQGVESRFDPNSVNKDTRACGLGQFVPATLNEKTFKYADPLGFPDAAKLIVRFDPKQGTEEAKAKGYKPTYSYRTANDDAKKTLEDFCKNERFNANLKAVYLTSNIAKLQTQLNDLAGKNAYFPVTSVQAYGAHFAGENRAAKMIRALQDPKQAKLPAKKFFSDDEVKQNALYFYDSQNKDRSLKAFFDNLAVAKGLGNDIMPDMRGWKIPQGEIEVSNPNIVLSGMQALSMTPQPEEEDIASADQGVKAATVPIPTPRPVHTPG